MSLAPDIFTKLCIVGVCAIMGVSVPNGGLYRNSLIGLFNRLFFGCHLKRDDSRVG